MDGITIIGIVAGIFIGIKFARNIENYLLSKFKAELEKYNGVGLKQGKQFLGTVKK